MEVRFSDDVVLQVNITKQMIKDWRECRLGMCRVGSLPNCEECSLNIDLEGDVSFGLCELTKVRQELNRR